MRVKPCEAARLLHWLGPPETWAAPPEFPGATVAAAAPTETVALAAATGEQLALLQWQGAQAAGPGAGPGAAPDPCLFPHTLPACVSSLARQWWHLRAPPHRRHLERHSARLRTVLQLSACEDDAVNALVAMALECPMLQGAPMGSRFLEEIFDVAILARRMDTAMRACASGPGGDPCATHPFSLMRILNRLLCWPSSAAALELHPGNLHRTLAAACTAAEAAQHRSERCARAATQALEDALAAAEGVRSEHGRLLQQHRTTLQELLLAQEELARERELRTEHGRLREEHGRLREEHGRLRDEHGRLRDQRGEQERLSREHERLRGEYGALEAAYARLRARALPAATQGIHHLVVTWGSPAVPHTLPIRLYGAVREPHPRAVASTRFVMGPVFVPTLNIQWSGPCFLVLEVRLGGGGPRTLALGDGEVTSVELAAALVGAPPQGDQRAVQVCPHHFLIEVRCPRTGTPHSVHVILYWASPYAV